MKTIILLIVVIGSGGTHTNQIQFDSFEKCEIAKMEINNQKTGISWFMTSYCFEK